jgi:opacity protein-like surface antigen
METIEGSRPHRQAAGHWTRAAILGSIVLLLAAAAARAQEPDPRGWTLRAWGGYSSLADTDGTIAGFTDAPVQDGIDVDTSGGFAAGAGIGYRYNRGLAVELAWEYRSNDSEVGLGSGAEFSGGDYASNTVFLNGFYHFASRDRWDPYLGVGIGWLQEVDIDLEGDSPERSFTGDGDFGVQVFAGSNFQVSNNWWLHGELRYGAFSGLDLDGENTEGSISDLDYRPFSVQFGLTYRF